MKTKKTVVRKIKSTKDTSLTILSYIKKNNISFDIQISNIDSGNDTDIIINKYFMNSPDYQRLLRHIEKQKKNILRKKTTLSETKFLKKLERMEKDFKIGTMRLAETFLEIRINTARLKKAKYFFEIGEILKADNILVESELVNNQTDLIIQMNYLQNRKVQLSMLIE